MYVIGCRVMLRCERDHDVRILGSNRRRIAVGKIDAAIGQANVIYDAAQLLRWDLLSNFIFHAVTRGSGFFNAGSSWSTHMECEFAGIHRREKILSQPRIQSEREE